VTEKTNNKQKNKKNSLALVWNLKFGICDLFEICLPAVFLAGCLEFEISLRFACPPSFWRGAWNL